MKTVLSRGIQSQIDHVRDQMQSLSADKALSPGEKMERRKELQDELSGLKKSTDATQHMQIQQEKLDKKNREIEKKCCRAGSKREKPVQGQDAGSGSTAPASGQSRHVRDEGTYFR